MRQSYDNLHVDFIFPRVLGTLVLNEPLSNFPAYFFAREISWGPICFRNDIESGFCNTGHRDSHVKFSHF